MARRVKFIEYDLTGEKVPLKFDVETYVFSADYGKLRFADKDPEKLEKEVLAAMKAANKVEFRPIIEVEVDLRGWSKLVSIDHFYVGQSGMKMVRLNWMDHAAHKLTLVREWMNPMEKGDPFTLPWRGQSVDRWGRDTYRVTYLYDYTEELWAAIETAVTDINNMPARVGRLFASGSIDFYSKGDIHTGAYDEVPE